MRKHKPTTNYFLPIADSFENFFAPYFLRPTEAAIAAPTSLACSGLIPFFSYDSAALFEIAANLAPDPNFAFMLFTAFH